MTTLAAHAEQSVRNGDPIAALAQLQERVRANPADAKLRIFLFQLLCLLGQWDRALNQLDVACELDPIALAMAQTYREAVRCEASRRDVFDGKTSPMVLGQPEPWLALLIESMLLAGRNQPAKSEELRLRAFADAETTSGEIDGRPFSWIADADSRLGPALEVIINGRYYWVPFSRLRRVTIDQPTDLRDFVWTPAHFEFENGGGAAGLIPTRYPGSESSSDGLIVLARKTVWQEVAEDAHHGLGQRIIATESDETPLMDIRSIVIHPDRDGETGPRSGDRGR